MLGPAQFALLVFINSSLSQIMLEATVRYVIMTTASLLLLAACQATTTVPTLNGVQTLERMPAASATFSRPKAFDGKGPPSATWIFASNGEVGNVDVYSAKTLKMISQCSCTGVGLAVDPHSGDLAVGTKSATVTVWHVKSKQITLFATLTLSQGPYAIGLAFDKKGDLYAANAGDNVIDFFKSTEIEAGGGGPTRTLVTSNLNDVLYLAADAHHLLADGYNSSGQPILVSVNRRTGADTILQTIESGSLPEGIVYGSGAENGYYTGISLNRSQSTLWAASFYLPVQSHGFGSVQANSYPLGSVGRSSTGIESEFYDSIAVDPQAK
jgi:WD40 repeat protein